MTHLNWPGRAGLVAGLIGLLGLCVAQPAVTQLVDEIQLNNNNNTAQHRTININNSKTRGLTDEFLRAPTFCVLGTM